MSRPETTVARKKLPEMTQGRKIETLKKEPIFLWVTWDCGIINHYSIQLQQTCQSWSMQIYSGNSYQTASASTSSGHMAELGDIGAFQWGMRLSDYNHCHFLSLEWKTCQTVKHLDAVCFIELQSYYCVLCSAVVPVLVWSITGQETPLRYFKCFYVLRESMVTKTEASFTFKFLNVVPFTSFKWFQILYSIELMNSDWSECVD